MTRYSASWNRYARAAWPSAYYSTREKSPCAAHDALVQTRPRQPHCHVSSCKVPSQGLGGVLSSPSCLRDRAGRPLKHTASLSLFHSSRLADQNTPVAVIGYERFVLGNAHEMSAQPDALQT